MVSNGIYDAGGCIKFSLDGNVVFINKSQIKTIDIIRNDVIRLDLGLGALRNLYIRLNDVVVPEGMSTPAILRDYIGGLIQNASGNGSLNTELVNALSELSNSLVKSALISLPLREDESQPSVLYRGYATPAASGDNPVWAIVKISRMENQNVYQWADADQNYDNIWNSRYELQYDALVR